MVERKDSNVTPKLRLVGSPVLSRASSRMDTFVSAEAGSNTKIAHTESQESACTGDELPVFERHEESTAIELFYDLFFVANLTTFSNLHEINNVKTLTSYIGFFCILWFTWCLTSLYDIRFVSDSLVARLAKGAHLGVMVGLAVSGPKFDTEEHNPELKVMALILMVSRFVLCLQYLLVLYHVREYKNTKLPLALISGTKFGAAIIYLGISFAFAHSNHAYRAFYVIAVAEMLINIGVSSQWKVVTFKGTHLIERMSLLTLYILGEGVIDILKSVVKISSNQAHWTSANIGALLGGITAIYLFYMLYFDTLNRHHFGSIRQQIWSFLHFPFHVALVLCLSGMAQFVIWQKIMEAYMQFGRNLTNTLRTFANSDGSTNFTNPDDLIRVVNSTIQNIFAIYPPTDNTTTQAEVGETVGALSEQLSLLMSNTSTDANYTGLEDAVAEVGFVVLNSIMDTYGFEAPPPNGTETVSDKTNAELDTASLVFEYFFIATGLTIIIMGILGLVNVRVYTKGSWLRFATHIVFGVALCLLSILATANDGDGAVVLAETAWPLPIVAIVVFVVLAVHHVSWEGKPKANGEKQYHFLPRWKPNSR
ncbi:hypothetical protein M430DRAFT_25883 [Amorphotheca resinae ATCC 22711]|uniref:Low temperature requirement A n=1 Tax=Amorphotheca resinae ATCC 22711 TaxID=857342 RepID=A0A2T3B7T0_AMORE|nr:hypothetical protein M430DRAFT_25883 [Amorphotheca resinae ATCC 22711]PSS22920.1 hypothetical protein M430DRAFT_25883 [Amorphotheca resinae ATCC 22711]